MEKKRICWKIFRKALQNAQQKSSSQKPSDQRIAGSCCEILPTSLAKWFSRVVTWHLVGDQTPESKTWNPFGGWRWLAAVGQLSCWVGCCFPEPGVFFTWVAKPIQILQFYKRWSWGTPFQPQQPQHQQQQQQQQQQRSKVQLVQLGYHVCPFLTMTLRTKTCKFQVSGNVFT